MASFPGQKATGPALPNSIGALTAAPVSATQVNLTWPAQPGLLNYKVYRGGVLISSPVLNALADTTLSAGTTYSYQVSGVNTHGEGARSPVATALTFPAQVTGLAAVAVSSSEIDSTWTATPTAGSYKVLRNGAQVGAPAVTSFADTGLPASTTFSYTVAAVNTSGTGTLSTAVNATTQAGTGTSTLIHPGHRGWMDGFTYSSAGGGTNQRNQLVATLPTLANVSNLFNGFEVCLTPANISDGTLDGSGNQTFATGRANILDILTLAKSVTTKKLYITLKAINGVFANTLPTTINRAYFPNWMPQSWVKDFEQSNGALRQQLDFDNLSIWSALSETAAGLFQLVYELDTDNRIDIICPFNDESVVGNVDSNGNTILNAANYNTQYGLFYQACKPQLPDRALWNTMSYFPPGDATAITAMQSQMQAAMAANPNGGVAFSGPDPTIFGTHGGPTGWSTTAQNIMTGVSGTMGDIRGNPGWLLIGHCEGSGMGGGSNFASCPPPAGSNQMFFDECMRRNSYPQILNSDGSVKRGAFTGFGNSVMHWNFTTFLCMTQTAIISLVNSNSGYLTPLPAGNWNTTP